MVKLGVWVAADNKLNPLIRKVTFYWILLTLILVDSWLLSKPNLLGKVGLIIYKYHYLRSFPRTLLTVWLVVSISILLVLLVEYLIKQRKLSKIVASLILGALLLTSLLMMVKVYIDFTAWTYSHTGWKFRYGAYLLPMIVMVVFINGLVQIQGIPRLLIGEKELPVTDPFPESPASSSINPDTSQL
jgi:hypothetical protein